MKILIVDDDAIHAMIASLSLQSAGYETEVVASGLEGAALCERDTFDLVLLDLHLPAFSGVETLKRIRQAEHAPPVVMLTASHELDDVLATRALGAIGYIEKPFSIYSVKEKIDRILEAGDVKWVDDYHLVIKTADEASRFAAAG